MSELPRIEEKIPSTDCGAVILSCDQSRLKTELIDLAQERWDPGDYEPLAEPFFTPDIAKHIVDASFGIEYDANDELYATGYVQYEIGRARQRYRAANNVLTLVQRHLESNIHFQDYSFTIKDGELSIDLDNQAFRIFVDIDRKYPGNCATIVIENDYSASMPATDDVYATAVIWAQVCDFVVRLGTGKHTALRLDQTTRVTLGQIADQPSDIELALVSEIEKRRRLLGAVATLPEFNEDILAEVVQGISNQENLSPDEIEQIAITVVNKKRENYATLDMMTDIDQSDIIEAFATVLKQRRSV
ncbi:MAG TPA: hypothetical protein VGE13_02145 [Candidatus Saccharimonadales bacterium]